MPEPLGIEHHARQKRADHEVQPRPVACQPAYRQPDQSHRPAVAFRQPLHQPPHRQRRGRKAGEEQRLSSDPFPIEQDDRQHAPDRDVIQAGIAQDALSDGLAQNCQLFHEQHEDRQRGDGAGHAHPQQHLPIVPVWPAPAGKLQDDGSGDGARDQRHPQRQPGGQPGFAPMFPRLRQIEFDPRDPHEQHHRPPRDAIQGGDHIGPEHEGVVIGERRAQHARAEHDAADDLHHHQRCPVINAQYPPHQPRNGENDGKRDQIDFGEVHGLASLIGGLPAGKCDCRGANCAVPD